MVIELAPSGFQGIMPRVADDNTPAGVGRIVHNADVRGGVLAPLAVGTPVQKLWGSDGKLLSDVPADEVAPLTAPDKITPVDSKTYICQLLSGGALAWMQILPHVYYAYWDEPTQQDRVIEITPPTLNLRRVQNTETGVLVTLTLGDCSFSCMPDVTYAAYGPRYQFKFLDDPNGKGGPNLGTNGTLWYPAENGQRHTDLYLPNWSISLWHNGQIYADLVVRDIQGPIWDRTGILYTTTGRSFYMYGGEVTFELGLEWADSRRKIRRFVQTLVNARGHESPASDPSDKIQVCPGEILSLNTPGTIETGGKRRLYEAGSEAGEDWLLLEEIETQAATWTDAGQVPQAKKLPELGSFAESGVSDAATFLEGAQLHPAGFVAAFVNVAASGGAPARHEVWVSEIDEYSSYPQDWARPFTEEILAIAITGGSILVFTTSRVWSLEGSDPANLKPRLLSDNYPMVSKLSLFRLGSLVGWVCQDGLAGSSGADVQLLTRDHYTRSEWQPLLPADLTTIKCSVADGAVLVEGLTLSVDGVSGKVLRFDTAGGPGACTTLDSLAAAGNPKWESPLLRTEKPTYLTGCLVDADDAVDLTITVDGVAQPVKHLLAADVGTPYDLGLLGPGRSWKFKAELKSAAAGKALRWPLRFYEREVTDVPEGGLSLPLEERRQWENLWLKLQPANRFVAGMVTTTTGTAVRLHFLDRDGVEKFTLDTDSGEFFLIDHANNTQRDLWRVKLTKTDNTSLETHEQAALELVTRRVLDMGRELRAVNRGGIPEWLVSDYKAQDRQVILAVRVNHRKSGTVKMRLFDLAGNRITDTQLDTLESGTETRLTSAQYLSGLRFDFDGEDNLVEEALIYPQTIQKTGGAPIQLVEPAGWLGGLYGYDDGAELACACALASDYSGGGVTLALRADNGADDLAGGFALSDGNFKRLPRTMGKHYLWDVEATFPGRLHTLTILPRTTVKVGGKVIELSADGPGVRRWLHERYQLPEGARLAAVLVEASAAVTLRLYRNGKQSETADWSKLVTPNVMQKILAADVTGGLEARTIDLDFGGDDQKVELVQLYLAQGDDLPAEGFEDRAAAESAVRPWLYTRRHSRKGLEPVSVFVQGVDGTLPEGLTLKLYKNGETAETPTGGIEIAAPGELDLAWTAGAVQEFEYDFGGSDAAVGLVQFFGRQALKIPVTGIVMREAEPVGNWIGRELEFKDTGSFRALRVVATDYTGLNVTLTCEGVEQWSGAVTSSEAVYLPWALANGRRWRLDIARPATSVIREVHLVGRVCYELPRSGVLPLVGEQDLPMWSALVRAGRPFDLAAARVIASGTVTLVLTQDGTETARETVIDGRPFLLPRMRRELTAGVELLAGPEVQIYEAAVATSINLLK